jgi:hypothetical protein
MVQNKFVTIKLKNTHYLQFRSKNSLENNIRICYGNKHVTNMSSPEFHGLHIDETSSWKYHIDQLVTKLSSACSS